MPKTVTLPETKISVDLPVLTWDEAEEILQDEARIGFDSIKRREHYRKVFEKHFPADLFDKIKRANRDVTYLMNAFTRHNFGLPEEEKN